MAGRCLEETNMSLIVHSYDGDVRLPNPNLRHAGGGGGHHHHHHHHGGGHPPPQQAVAVHHHPRHPGSSGSGRGGGGGGGGSGQPPPGYRSPGGREYRAGGRRRTRYLLLGATCMIPGLALYFGGGYLFVAAYNGRYPFAEVSVEALLIRIFWYVGPIFFFIGLIIFVVAYATLCKGIDSSDY